MNNRASLAGGATILVFVLVQVGALALVGPFRTAGLQAVENPSDPTNSIMYLLGIAVATGVMLAAFRFGAERLIHVIVVASSAFLTYYVLSVFVPPVWTVAGTNLVAAGTAGALALALFVHPEWYVIDAIGILMGMGAAGLFGISLGLFPALVLLVVLAVYDAISVYGTEHMLTLASGVMDLKVPVVLVIPMTLSYSYLDSTPPTGSQERAEISSNGGTSSRDDEQRDAFFIGLGDAVMPSVLVASATVFLPTEPLVPGFALTLPALTAMLGTLVGLVVLVQMVVRGRAHAGLPLLNGGAIAGYLVGALASGVPIQQALGLGTHL